MISALALGSQGRINPNPTLLGTQGRVATLDQQPATGLEYSFYTDAAHYQIGDRLVFWFTPERMEFEVMSDRLEYLLSVDTLHYEIDEGAMHFKLENSIKYSL